MNTPVIPTDSTGRYQSRNVLVVGGNEQDPTYPYVSIQFTPRRPGFPKADIITVYAHDVTVSA